MSEQIKGFFAYPSSPANLAATIENGIARINKGQTVLLESWKQTNITGKFIIGKICKKIDEAQLFAWGEHRVRARH